MVHIGCGAEFCTCAARPWNLLLQWIRHGTIYTEAVRWYKKAAEQGDAHAQNNLGCCYENGDGVELSYNEAFKWFTLAAEQGNAFAQYNLGYCYENGEGVGKSFTEAVKWYKKAAEQGHEEAKKKLDFMEL